MGIRFECPNGHRLNVKSHLAGKRGICPECRAKFTIPTSTDENSSTGESVVIPAESRSNATAPTTAMPTPESTSPLPRSEAPESAPAAALPPASLPPTSPPPLAPPATQAMPAPPPLPPTVSSMPDVWYVRAANGEQFGPANTETFNGWAAAGRVPADSLVWRTGWPEWKSGTQALTELNLPAAPIVDVAPAPETVLPAEEELTAEPPPAENYRIKQRKRRERAKLFTMLLTAVVFLLLVVLVVVLIRN